MIKSQTMLFTIAISIYILNSLWITCQAVPLIDLRNTMEQNVLDAMITSACSSNGECWEWLPIQELHENIPTVPENLPILKTLVRRQTLNTDPNTIIDSWNDGAATLEKNSQSYIIAKRNGNKFSKKDALMPRGWSAGGMPFSVLYMNPYGPHGNHANTEQQHEIGKTVETSTPSLAQSNSRIAIRNGNPSLPRRQYSIIPQLFISYGWGSFGK
ncbi:uncharacterized protein LOC105663198 isoform X1 [Megachile rotundata]|uniref:uncharacterized protein LOC105663198 isoform X1 n=1 Tax=Megachile rotundata TaxID=143995 RepID=UPI003FD31CBA